MPTAGFVAEIKILLSLPLTFVIFRSFGNWDLLPSAANEDIILFQLSYFELDRQKE